MSAALLLAYGPRIFLVRSDGTAPEAFDLPATGGPARVGPAFGPDDLPAPLLRALDRLAASTELRVAGEPLLRAVRVRSRRDVAGAGLADWRQARLRLPPLPSAEERSYLAEVAEIALAASLRSPDEVLITLAREEERLERAVGREARAAESFLPVPESEVAEYLDRWADARGVLQRHHAALVEQVEQLARAVAPNLTAVVGGRVAARLLATAGSLAALGRMRSARIQLLGSKRRPSPDRGPRFGVIYRADRMVDVPVGRRAAYARSLAALAAIAVRADATTRAPIAAALVRRRDRRIDALRRGGR